MESDSNSRTVVPWNLPAGIFCLDVEQCRAPSSTPEQLLSPHSSLLYHYQMVQLSLYKHCKENPAEAILKIGGTDLLELFRSLS